MATLGGVHDSQQGGSAQNSVEIEGLARFAVEQHNKKEVHVFLFFFVLIMGFCFKVVLLNCFHVFFFFFSFLTTFQYDDAYSVDKLFS